MTIKNKTNLLKQAINRAKSSRRLMVIEMPEESDTTLHWLAWLIALSFIGLVATVGWQLLNGHVDLQAYLPFL